MIVLSEQAQTILADAGWYEGRNIDVTETVTFLEAKGYDVFPCVIEVLKEFGGLECSYKRPDGRMSRFISIRLRYMETIMKKKIFRILKKGRGAGNCYWSSLQIYEHVYVPVRKGVW